MCNLSALSGIYLPIASPLWYSVWYSVDFHILQSTNPSSSYLLKAMEVERLELQVIPKTSASCVE